MFKDKSTYSRVKKKTKTGMQAVLLKVRDGFLWGSLVGISTGLVSAVMLPQPAAEAKAQRLTFRSAHKTLVLDTYGIPGTENVILSITRADEALRMDPSVRPCARARFRRILLRLRRFLALLHLLKDSPQDTAARTRMRSVGRELLQSLADFEAYVWDSTELVLITQCLSHLQQVVNDSTLQAER